MNCDCSMINPITIFYHSYSLFFRMRPSDLHVLFDALHPLGLKTTNYKDCYAGSLSVEMCSSFDVTPFPLMRVLSYLDIILSAVRAPLLLEAISCGNPVLRYFRMARK